MDCVQMAANHKQRMHLWTRYAGYGSDRAILSRCLEHERPLSASAAKPATRQMKLYWLFRPKAICCHYTAQPALPALNLMRRLQPE